MIICDLPILTVPRDIMTLEAANVERLSAVTGGDAMNVAKTLRILGAQDVALAGLVGEDIFGKFLLGSAGEAGIDTRYIRVQKNLNTSTACHLIASDGTHSLFQGDVNEQLSFSHFAEEQFTAADIVYFGSALFFPRMDDGGIEQLFSAAHRQGAVTALDTAMFRNQWTPDAYLRKLDGALHRTDIFIPSLQEISFLTGKTDPEKIAAMMKPYGMRVFGIKLGRQGSYITDFHTALRLSAFTEFHAVDTIGAGDSFMGSFLYAYAQGWDLPRCAALAGVVSAHNVAAVGATGGVPDIRTALQYLEQHPASMEITAFSCA